ncbi:MAG: hypothetical protein COU33_02405 [Candidatus Magasanikbacteria bacterium CG10_big_fil_rev_8_21_14_0_10_43_6]|uniref:GtrA/DPMS transmembrane domain-containing protein n=1 Tax=Candidatus Magasanikbacteria bacterium CG10_big_fil_rev_8_21_14_0_10_43_6 TaxID=1974650 RepID=A0A2M6W189_9BACT|nr:MAG: hypothetical protein COU33_02405 [Candidatus Magasanikbacteria bacterium CG10_big_fil_rev_8_21_14_0_10_43_6]
MRRHKEQFVRYFVVGMSGFVIDIGTLFVLSKYYGINPTIAVVLNQIVVIGYNFTLNKYWSFSNRDLPHKQLIRYGILAGGNYLFSVVLMYTFNQVFGIDEILVRIGTIALMTLWNFVLYKKWVYR